MRMDTLSYVAAAEPLARAAAASGHPLDLKRLSVVLNIKGSGLRDKGREPEAIAAELECIKTLDILADAGDDNALQLLTAFSRMVSPYALGAATAQRAFEAVPAGPPPVDPIGASSGASARGRVWWWLQDRWDDLRWWIDDLAWVARLRCWSITDRLRGWKE